MALYLLGVLALCFMLFCVLPTWYYKWFYPPLFSHSRPERSVMLTFDDGPDIRYTGRLLTILADSGVRAVFFVVAKKAEQNPDLIRRMLREGHCIGLHSLAHRSVWCSGWRGVKGDFEESLSILARLGCPVVLYRPPWGQFSLTSIFYARKYRLKILLWNVMVQDWQSGSTPRRVLRRLLARTRPGSVICLHDSGDRLHSAGTAPLAMLDVLPDFLHAMIQNGYRFVVPDDEVL